MLRTVLFVGAVAFSGVAFAENDSHALPQNVTPIAAGPQEAAGADAQEDRDNVVVCRRTAEIGSRLRGRDCRTRAEWARARSDNQEEARQSTRDQARHSAMSAPDFAANAVN